MRSLGFFLHKCKVAAVAQAVPSVGRKGNWGRQSCQQLLRKTFAYVSWLLVGSVNYFQLL